MSRRAACPSWTTWRRDTRRPISSICRSGATTVAELACAGVASVLVPFPFATDDHQTANASFLSERGAAVLCRSRAHAAAARGDARGRSTAGSCSDRATRRASSRSRAQRRWWPMDASSWRGRDEAQGQAHPLRRHRRRRHERHRRGPAQPGLRGERLGPRRQRHDAPLARDGRAGVPRPRCGDTCSAPTWSSRRPR